jgi:hypothetical protein
MDYRILRSKLVEINELSAVLLCARLYGLAMCLLAAPLAGALVHKVS